MNSQVLGLRVAGTAFGLIALLQLTRFIMQLEVTIAGHVVPLGFSAVAFIVLGGLSVWMWKLARGHN